MVIQKLVKSLTKKGSKRIRFGGKDGKTKSNSGRTQQAIDGDASSSSFSEDRRVRFDDLPPEVHKVVPRVSQFSRESLAAIWFDEDDFQDFLDDMKDTIHRSERGKSLKDKKYTLSGLESYTEEGQALKRGFREDAGGRRIRG